MFRSRADMDDTLRRMTDSFSAGLGSLEGGLRTRRLRTQSAASTATGALGVTRAGVPMRASPVPEEGVSPSGSSGSASPVDSGSGSGLGLGLVGARRGGAAYRQSPSANMSSSSLFAGGRRSYDSGEQIVGKMDFGEEEEAALRARARSSDTARGAGPSGGRQTQTQHLHLVQQHEGDFDAARRTALHPPRTARKDFQRD